MTKPRFVLVTDDPSSWAVESNQQLAEVLTREGFSATLVHKIAEAPDADVAVYLNCIRIIPASERARYRHNIVVHASELPRGRGWSPLTWQILEGKDRVALTLFEAADEVDSGPIYMQTEMVFAGHELVDELRAILADASNQLVLAFARAWPNVLPRQQSGEGSFYPRRRPVDSKLDIDKPLRDSFNLLRVVDNERYPAYFEHAGHIYELKITKRGPA